MTTRLSLHQKIAAAGAIAAGLLNMILFERYLVGAAIIVMGASLLGGLVKTKEEKPWQQWTLTGLLLAVLIVVFFIRPFSGAPAEERRAAERAHIHESR